MISSFIEEIHKEIALCKHSFIYFFDNHLKVINPTKGLVPFNLYDYQIRFLRECEDNRFTVAATFRQGGFTSLVAGWMLWKCLFELDHSCLCVLNTERDARQVSRIVDRFLDNLPDWMMPELSKDNQHEKHFTETNSRMRFATTSVAYSETKADILVVDNAAFIPDMVRHWTAMYPLLSCGGKAIVISVPTRKSTWFCDLVEGARAGKNNFKEFVCEYKENPEFVADGWEDDMKKNLSEASWRQEYLREFAG